MSDIQIIKGDTSIFEVDVTRLNESTGLDEAVDLTDAKAWFTAKETFADPDDQAIVLYNSEDDIANITIAEIEGIVRVSIDPADTAAYPNRWLVYDVQIKEVDGTVTTVERGNIELLKQATISQV
jgi:hypothetical protein